MTKMNQTQSARRLCRSVIHCPQYKCAASSIRTIRSVPSELAWISSLSRGKGASEWGPTLASKMGLTGGFIMSSSVLADLVLILDGKTVRKMGFDPSGPVPDNEACTPDAVGVGASPLSTQRSQGSTRRGSTVFPKYVIDASSGDGIKSPSGKGSAKFLDVTITSIQN